MREESDDIELPNNQSLSALLKKIKIKIKNVRNFRPTMNSIGAEKHKDLSELEEKTEHETRYVKMEFQITNFFYTHE